ncbi:MULTISPECIES: BCCT family transporter [Marinobacter]|uniref:BCCT family transporter n=1 Tax=Marinobacter TaxID=2742 RepID=UPI001D079B59|nr:BCCT family transporter [Marinobacter sp. CA1]MCG8518063.1 BCCT family transporter [Pseudomonadales bacterium]MCK7566464.1 BCCT family transporter [Marinobacter xestospongiae]UDL06599.1 BCCT family transporter [Marinobacter sp. CA1]
MGDVVKDEYQTDYVVGQDNINPLGLDLHAPVFPIAAVLVVLFVVGTLIFPAESKELLDGAKWGAINTFDWFFLISANIFVVVCLALIFMPVGKIRLGGQDAKPEFSTMSWFAMLFAAGMGIGLMFWAVAEPVAYYTDWYGTPLGAEANSEEGARMAMGATMYHWGLHPWAIYAIVALSLAFFAFNKGMPLTIRSAFFPLLRDRVWGWPGHLIDILAVLATIFGLATSLGFGAQQAASGMDYLFGISSGIGVQMTIITGVTLVALLSVLRGLDGGVKVLSNINMGLAALLLFFIIFAGPTMTIIETLWVTSSTYVANIMPLSNPFGREDETWFHGWTVFYWAWWISWSPFVGMFIARVSKGRTVREFVTAVLIIPTVITVFWMSAFGGSALDQIQNGIGSLAANGLTEVPLAMFQMLENLPLTAITSFIGIVLVLVFFVTSSDSGSLVIDSITAGGKTDAPTAQRVFWVIMEGAIAAALIFGGGADALGAIQATAITAGLPFTLILLAMTWGLLKGLTHERKLLASQGKL